jgi:hypothetical protein
VEAIIEPMWQVKAICSDPDCAEELDLWIDQLEEIDRAVCACECSVVALAVENFEPVRLPVAAPA